MRKTIFISSTFMDLAGHRKAIWGLLEEFDVSVRGMEQFGARKETPLETCITEVEQSDIYVGLIAFRLGSIEEGSGKSYTQLEYERAQSLSKETLIYLIDEENARVAMRFIERGINLEKLDAFKRTLRDRHTVDTFVTEEDLVEKLRRDLKRHLSPSSPSPHEPNEFSEALTVIRQFMLVPKQVAGREIRIEVKVTGEAYPASREICSAFNYEFGATVGVPVEIVKPEGIGESGLSELYLSAKQIDGFLPVGKDELRNIYAKLQFSAAPIDKIRTRFKDESYTKLQLASISAVSAFDERVSRPPEAKVVLAFTKSAESLKAPTGNA
jgi:hypothetical protein